MIQHFLSLHIPKNTLVSPSHPPKPSRFVMCMLEPLMRSCTKSSMPLLLKDALVYIHSFLFDGDSREISLKKRVLSFFVFSLDYSL